MSRMTFPLFPGARVAALLLLTATAAHSVPAQAKPAASKAAASKAASSKAADISGNWLVTGTSPTDTLKSTAVFKQEGLAVSGTFQIPLIGSGKLTGVIRGDSVLFTIPFVLQEKPVEVHVDGLIKDKNTIGGIIKLPNSAMTYPFIARRQP